MQLRGIPLYQETYAQLLRALMHYVGFLIEGQQIPSFDPGRVYPRSIDTEIRAIYGLEDGERTANLIIPQRSISYSGSGKRDIQNVLRDRKLQSYQDCLFIINCIFDNSFLGEYIDRVMITIVNQGDENLPLEEINRNEDIVIIDEIELSRREFSELQGQLDIKIVSEKAAEYHQNRESKRSLGTEDSQQKKGYIYVLTNPYMEGLLKIGKTTRTTEERAEEISKGTGVPADFKVAYEEFFPDCDTAETKVHQKLEQYRVSTNREFFQMQLKDAIQTVREVAEELKS